MVRERVTPLRFVCPKCGCIHNNVYYDNCMELLKVTCARCRFQWSEKTLDDRKKEKKC
jgi:hypothetical protein